MQSDFHAQAVAAVARQAQNEGKARKAIALFLTVLEHHRFSAEARDALNYLLTAVPHRPALRVNTLVERRA